MRVITIPHGFHISSVYGWQLDFMGACSRVSRRFFFFFFAQRGFYCTCASIMIVGQFNGPNGCIWDHPAQFGDQHSLSSVQFSLSDACRTCLVHAVSAKASHPPLLTRSSWQYITQSKLKKSPRHTLVSTTQHARTKIINKNTRPLAHVQSQKSHENEEEKRQNSD